VSAADLAAVCESWLVIMFDLRLIAFFGMKETSRFNKATEESLCAKQ
jgi:hypothetical protein